MLQQPLCYNSVSFSERMEYRANLVAGPNKSQMTKKYSSRFMSDRFNRICLKAFLWSAIGLLFIYVLNHFIRDSLDSDTVQTKIYFVSVILVYGAILVTILSLLLIVLNLLRKSLFR
jgi:hypothetical protein